MDRLNNISRNGGYPWVAEEISIIEKHADYINAMLDSMKLHGGSCVFVQRNETQNGNLMQSVVYIVKPNETHGELYYIAADNDVSVSSLLDGTSDKKNITITETNQDVTGDQSTTYDDCYITKTAALASGSVYTFYDLNDLLRPAVWKDYLPSLQTLCYEAGESWASSCLSLRQETYSNILRGNSHEIQIRLDYSNGNVSYVDSRMKVEIQDSAKLMLPLGTLIPLNAMVMANGSQAVYPCYIMTSSDGAEIHLPKISIPTNADLYINGIIPIK